jgi:ABC-type transporter Mla MlaB component
VIFSLFGKKDGRSGERRRGVSSGGPGGPVGGGSQPASRTTDPRELARLTAAKIDEIESQMIAPSRRSDARAPAIPAQAGLAGTVYVPSGVAPAVRSTLVTTAVSTAPRTFAGAAGADTSLILGGADDGSSRSLELAGSSLPPAFEEAAVLYSNGQGATAETVLWQAIQAIQANQLGGHTRQAWAMLFDLYLASGRKPEFEALAIDYSARFETSPPAWDDALAPPPTEARPAAGTPAAVVMPESLDAQAVRPLEQVQRFAQRNREVALDVGPIRRVDPIGADLLLRVIRAFAKAARGLRVQGAESLLEVLSGTTEAGRRDPSESCWLLRLELLRLLGRQQAFEDLSIDYCVTYEVSPPSWEPMPAAVRAVSGRESAAAPAAPAPLEVGFVSGTDAFVLRGELEGRVRDMLAALRVHLADRAEAVLDCRSLRRLDFVAAGELLNEVVALRAGGKYLVFRDVSHPVAALLAVMGIPDLAEVRLRVR